VSLFADQSREQLRGAYREVWRKWRARVPLQPLEAQIADIIVAHPEYQALLQDEASLKHEYGADRARENPFLHMGLHLALREQIGTDRPAGIASIHRQLTAIASAAHEAEHRMIEVLAGVLSEAARLGRPPQDSLYLERLRQL
jgi:Domain of unknown function (DUF1841)